MKHCLFIHTGYSSFIQTDLELIKDNCKVFDFCFIPGSIVKIFKSSLKLFIFITKNIWETNFILIWFADYHSILPVLIGRIIGKKVFLILGGSDCQYIPDYKLGNIYGPLGIRKLCVKLSLKYAHTLFPVDSSLIYNENKYLGKTFRSGVKTLIDSSFRSSVRPTSIKPIWKIEKKENIILSVASINSQKRILLKGLDLFIEVAKALPDACFVFVGLPSSIKLGLSIPNNMTVYPLLQQEELIPLYAKAKVFALFSIYEGLPNVLLEAMASGCIPVTSAVSGMTTLTKKFGYLLQKKNVRDATNLIQNALNDEMNSPEKISAYIYEEYNINKRDNFIKELCKGQYDY